MWRPCHNVHLYSPSCGTYKPVNNYEVLETFILNKKRVCCFIDEVCYSLSPISNTPNKMRFLTCIKFFTMPVCFKAHADLFYFIGMRSYYGIIPRFKKIFYIPVK